MHSLRESQTRQALALAHAHVHTHLHSATENQKKKLLLADAMSVRCSCVCFVFVFHFRCATTTCAGVLHQQVQFEILMVRELPNIVVTVEFNFIVVHFFCFSVAVMVWPCGYVLDGKSRASASIVVIYATLISDRRIEIGVNFKLLSFYRWQPTHRAYAHIHAELKTHNSFPGFSIDLLPHCGRCKREIRTHQIRKTAK